MVSSAMLRRVALVRTDVSEEPGAMYTYMVFMVSTPSASLLLNHVPFHVTHCLYTENFMLLKHVPLHFLHVLYTEAFIFANFC
jgi:hypothetical protein